MKPRVFLCIATDILGGPGKGILQFLLSGGLEQCDPVVSNFQVGTPKTWQFREEIEQLPVAFVPLLQTMTFDPFLIQRALRVVRAHDIQVLQSHGYKSNALCTVLKWITGLPHIAFMHGWTAENWRIRAYRLLDLFLYRFADRVVIVSESMRPKLVRVFIPERKIVYIPNAVELTGSGSAPEQLDLRRLYGLSRETPIICVIGRLSPEKGQAHFIEALHRMADWQPTAVAILVGDGQERPLLEEMVRRFDLGRRVVFAGYQSATAPYYSGCDLVVIPSLSEGMPNVALETMSFGKPVVATRVGGIPEVVVDGETGVLVPAADPYALARAMADVLADPGLQRRYGAAGWERVEKEFCPQHRARKIIALYREVLGRASSGTVSPSYQ